MNEGRESKAPFRGYSSPNYTPVPDELFDEQLPDLSGAELKVLLYVIRRTFGFKRESDNISLSQMLNGLRTRDGRVLDRGVGLSKKTLLQAIKSLEEQAIVLTERRRSQEKGDEPTSYRLNVRSGAKWEETTPPVGEKVPHGGGAQIPPGGWGSNSPTQETVRQKTDLDLSKFERSHDDADKSESGRQENSFHDTISIAQHGKEGGPENRLVPPREITRLRAAAMATIGNDDATILEPEAPFESPRRGRPGGTSEERELLAAYLGDFATQLGDEAPLSSTITRTLNILKQANVPMGRWPELLYEAKAITWEHSAQIKKKPSDPSKTASARVRVPYYLAVLEQLVGVRPAPTERVQANDHGS